MSYPPGPQDPYGPPPQPGQPPQQPGQPPQQPPQQPQYGYPQQPPQQPQYGYPQQQQSPYGYGAAGYPAYPAQGGYPGMPQEMPGMLKAARVILFIVAGLQIIAGLVLAIGGAALSSAGTDDSSGAVTGALIAVALFVLAVAALLILLGVKFSKGGNGVRIGTIIYASLMLVGGVGNLVRGAGVGILSAVVAFAVGGFLLAAMLQSDSNAWFNRPRY